jgi:ArsR family transcriptional regulator, lead/cadmium/zinc/bismuth-responsive transcriptional repressor
MKVAPYVIPDLDGDQIVEIADILRLLGEPSRLRILLACLAEPAPVGELAERVGMARSLVSHHLRMLRASRLLRSDRNGKQIIYSAIDDRVRCILADLAGHVVETPEDKDEA